MSITDELREFMDGADGYELWCPRHKKELTAIADRIDDALKERYIELPKDVDGEHVHRGDKMKTVDGNVYEVDVLQLSRRKWSVGLESVDDSYFAWYDSETLRHHHEPTVEDVLEEYRIRYYDLVTDMECKNITNEEYTRGISSLNAEYAAKLQLRSVGE